MIGGMLNQQPGLRHGKNTSGRAEGDGYSKTASLRELARLICKISNVLEWNSPPENWLLTVALTWVR